MRSLNCLIFARQASRRRTVMIRRYVQNAGEVPPDEAYSLWQAEVYRCLRPLVDEWLGTGLTRMGVNRHPPGTSSELHGPFRPYWSTRRNTKRALNSPQDQQFRNYSSANHTRFLTNGTTSSWRQPRKQVDTRSEERRVGKEC